MRQRAASEVDVSTPFAQKIFQAFAKDQPPLADFDGAKFAGREQLVERTAGEPRRRRRIVHAKRNAIIGPDIRDGGSHGVILYLMAHEWV
jgi:hypothetical protein